MLEKFDKFRIFKKVEFQTETPTEAHLEASDNVPPVTKVFTESETARRITEAGEYCEKKTQDFADFADALTATPEETACARYLRDELSDVAPAKLEAFKTSPYAGRNCCLLLALVYFVALLFYMCSFAGSPVSGIVLAVFALLILLGGGFVAGAMFLGARKFVKILPKKISYNVVSSRCPSGDPIKERTLIVATNHDASAGAFLRDFDLVRKVVFVTVPVSVVLFLMFCAIRLGVGTDGVTKATSLTVIPFVTSMAGIIALAIHFSPMQRHARENNNAGTAVALALYRYFVSAPGVLPEGTTVYFVSFGGENSAHAGSRAFAAAHPEIKGAKAIVIGDIQSSNFKLIHKDSLRGTVYSQTASRAALAAADKHNVSCSLAESDDFKSKLNSLHGYSASALAEAGCDCAMFVAKDYTEKGHTPDKEDMSRLFALALGTAVNMMEEKNAKQG